MVSSVLGASPPSMASPAGAGWRAAAPAHEASKELPSGAKRYQEARQRLRDRADALGAARHPQSGRLVATGATPEKHRFAEEGPTHGAEDTVDRQDAPTPSTKGKKKKLPPASVRTARSSASSRFDAMMSRDEEEARRAAESVRSARQSARRSARRAAARFHENPLPTTVTLPAEWRKWPSGSPESRDVNGLWADVSETHLKGSMAVDAFVAAGAAARDPATRDATPAADVDSDRKAAAIETPPGRARTPVSPAEALLLSEGGGTGLSSGPSAKLRAEHAEKALERRDRERIVALKARVVEEEARRELEDRRRRNDMMRAKQRSVRSARQSKTDRAKVQQRLYHSPRRARYGAVYA